MFSSKSKSDFFFRIQNQNRISFLEFKIKIGFRLAKEIRFCQKIGWGVKFESILRLIFHPILGPTLEIRFFLQNRISFLEFKIKIGFLF